MSLQYIRVMFNLVVLGTGTGIRDVLKHIFQVLVLVTKYSLQRRQFHAVVKTL